MKCPSCGIENLEDSKFCRKCATALPRGEASFTRTLINGPAEFAAGSVIADRYKIARILGRGGMGVVYLADDTRLKRPVALKFLPPGLALDEDIRSRFMIEAQAAAALSHPNICTIYEVDGQAEKAFISMEYVEGESLREKVAKGPLPFDHVLDIALQVCAGLDEAHKKGIVHRDIKSANIMLTASGRAKIMDFGLAKVAGTAMITKEGSTMGTVAYMSPEQARGEAVDTRTDIWSLGVVLYELASGKLPFRGDLESAILHNIIHEEPKPLKTIVPKVPEEFERMIRRALKKRADDRYGTAAEMLADLRKVHAALEKEKAGVFNFRSFLRIIRKPLVAIPFALVLIALGFMIHSILNRQAKIHWAERVAIPEIERLLNQSDNKAAFDLALQAEKYIPKNPTLTHLWPQAVGSLSIETVPAGADVSIRPYNGNPNAWESLGKTPLVKVRVPLRPSHSSYAYVFRYAKQGFVTRYEIGDPGGPEPLDPEGSIPADMARVPVSGGTITASINGRDQLPEVPAQDYLIDRTEVTNEEYSKFVAGGGYEKRELWKQPFVKDGQTIPWEEAVTLFRDTTGRPGPATWEVGSFPKGLERYPVAGVSWYEAAAYAEFMGKSLPTVYHWFSAGGGDWAPIIVPGSNFRDVGTVPVGGQGTLNTFGTYDMAGNVKEWCWNESSEGKRFILGGGFGEPSYMFIQADTQSPWDRRPHLGFRCVKLPSAPSPAATGKIEFAVRDFSKEKPVSDEVLNAFKGLYAYDKGELDARVEETVVTEDGTRERVSFNAAYGGERVVAYLFLPKSVVPPFQTVVYFPSAAAIWAEKFENDYDFFMKSGRAQMYPLYKGTYERRDALKTWAGEPTAFYRDHMIAWSKDLGRSIDYLETRRDIDLGSLAYIGNCWGTDVAPVMLAVENRFKVAILVAGGLVNTRALPEADQINFVPRVRVPVLMLNGRYDAVFPLGSSQLPLFQLLGTPEMNKRHVIYESGHDLPRKEVIRETLDWLDRYLGPVKR
jgi:serine/threonine protein kinase/dienelactone hydrolase